MHPETPKEQVNNRTTILLLTQMEFEDLVRSELTEKYNLLQKKKMYTEEDLKHLSQNIINWKHQHEDFDKAVKAGILNPQQVQFASLELMNEQIYINEVLIDIEDYSKELRSKLNETIARLEKEESH